MRNRIVELKRYAWVMLPTLESTLKLHVVEAELRMAWSCYPPEAKSRDYEGDNGSAECVECYAIPVKFPDMRIPVDTENLSHMLGENLVEVAMEQAGIEDEEAKYTAAEEKADRQKEERMMKR